MKKLASFSARACWIDRHNVDTDMIIPQNELITTSKSGLGNGLFARLRYLHGREVDNSFSLNFPENRNSKIIISGHNFGCGSSREHAPWALSDFGIVCIVAPSFADIFYRNAIKNSILPALITSSDYQTLSDLCQPGYGISMNIDLDSRLISGESFCFPFSIAESDLQRLVLGIDDISVSMTFLDEIEKFESFDRCSRPWIYDQRWVPET